MIVDTGVRGPLPAGTKIGPYEILELLGAGGMGEVYRARDPRLNRHVAIKILPERLGHSEDRLERFEREARAAGTLNHPNVLTVFDVGSAQGTPYLVTELLEGETLRSAMRLQRAGAHQVALWMFQAAEGLASAHEAGILHRDLKPENLFLTRDGRLKILDFGLAKLTQPGSGGAPGAPTATHGTTSGRLLGTAAYMSPEQIRDERLDGRSDVFALGAILYELLAGRPAFTGAAEGDVMAAVLRDQPPTLESLGARAPAALEAVIERCLEKRREDRFGSARELAAALQLALESLTRERRYPSLGWGELKRGATRRRGLLAGGMGALAGTALLGAALFSRPAARPEAPAPPPPPMDTVLLTTHPGRELEPALARDGQRVAFVWDGPDGGNFDLYTKVTGVETALRLTAHPAYDGTPAWSPDGRWIAFLRVERGHGTVYRVPSTGGHERKIRDVEPWFGSSISFSPDGRWIAVSDRPQAGQPFGVILVSVERPETVVLTRPGPSSAGDAFPAFAPDGRTIAFARVPAQGAVLHWAAVSVVPAAGGSVRRLTPGEDHVVGGLDWSRDGRDVVFSASGGDDGIVLWRVPLAGGLPVPAFDRPFAISNLLGAEAVTQVSRFFRVSAARDADRLAFARSHYHTDIWQIDTSGRRAARPLVTSTQVDEAPQISPDGRRVAFSSTRGSKSPQIWTCDADGSRCAQLTTFQAACGTPRWSPDGARIVFDTGSDGQSEIYVIEVATGDARRLTHHAASDIVPSWSRDGASVYFASDRGGEYQVWRMPAGGGLATAVTTGGGFAAFESPDGRELYFTRHARPGLWAAPAGGGPERQVLDQPPCWGYWALGRHGIYVLDGGGPRGPRIALRRWGSPGLEHVTDVPAEPACGESGLALSPDARTLLYVGASRDSDIMMVDGFR